MNRKRGLGKGFGIGALIPDTIEEDIKQERNLAEEIDINLVEPNKDQPRKDFDEDKLLALAESIKEHGMVQPIVAVKEGNYYRIVAGERRWRASKKLGLKTVPVIVKEYSVLQAEEIALVENLQRENLNAIEEANGYRRLMDTYGLTQEEVAQKVGKSRPAVANSLRFLMMPKKLRDMLSAGDIAPGHAKVLMSVTDLNKMEALADRVRDEDLSVRQLEALAKEEKPKKKKQVAVDRDVKLALDKSQKTLEEKYGVKVKLNYTDKFKGKVELGFKNYKQMVELLEKLGIEQE